MTPGETRCRFSQAGRNGDSAIAERVLLGSLGLVAYTFLGYPAAVATLAKLWTRPPVLDPGYEPNVTLVVVAYNEEDVIAEKLENSRGLDYPSGRLELLVVADGSDDETVERARASGAARVLHEPVRRGKLAAMARAADAATGEILVFSDANNLYEPGTLRAVVAPFADPSVGVVSGRKVIDDGSGRGLDRAESLYWRYESALKKWETATGSVAAVAGEIIAFRRAAFRVPGHRFLVEDFVQAMLAALDGWRVVYAPDAVSVERASATVGDEATRRARIVSGRWQALVALLPRLLVRRPGLALKVISHKGLRPLVPGALVLAALSNVASARRGRASRLLLAGQAGFYAAALAGYRNERAGRRNRLLFLAYYFCRMNFATLAGLHNFLRGRDAAVWAKVRRG